MSHKQSILAWCRPLPGIRAAHKLMTYLWYGLLQDVGWEGSLRESALRIVGGRQHCGT